MNTKKIMKDLSKYFTDAQCIESALIYAFAKITGIEYLSSELLNDCISKVDSEICESTYQYFIENCNDFSFSNLVELFELLVPSTEKKEKGVVYTPSLIKDYIVGECVSTSYIPITIDPACGCGSFLVTVAKRLHSVYGASYSEIVSNYIYGVDIDENAIRKTKLLLTLLASMNGEYELLRFNLVCADMLDPYTLDKLKELCSEGFDCVIGNPPYVRSRNMGDDVKLLFSNWETSSVGNIDLYIPFFEVGLKILKPTGKLGYISPNSYLQATNGRGLRKYLVNQKHPVEIIDFRDAQMFKNVTSYTCITLIDKAKSDDTIYYVRINEKETLSNHTYSEYPSSNFSDGQPWRMRKNDIDLLIHKLENTGRPLANWKIRNGLATLKNDLYFFMPDKEDTQYYYRTYNGKTYSIEKDICIEVAKPNIIKNEQELRDKIEVGIFPYRRDKDSFVILEESVLQKEYPMTYAFFCDYRNELELRDKGRGKYPAWYAYGRTQGMNNFGKKLLIPYIAGCPTAVISTDENLLFYCGYALFSEDEEELKIIKAFLESDAFGFIFFIQASLILKDIWLSPRIISVKFTIPDLSRTEVKYILSNLPCKELNDFIWNKYGIIPSELQQHQ